MNKLLQLFLIPCFLFLVSCFLFLVSCESCPNVIKEIPTSAFYKLKVGNSTYCKVAIQAFEKGDEAAIISLSKDVQVFDGGVYEHGYVLIRLIDKIGEERYKTLIGGLSKGEIKTLHTYLRAGFELIAMPKYKDKSIEESFPLLSHFIND